MLNIWEIKWNYGDFRVIGFIGSERVFVNDWCDGLLVWNSGKNSVKRCWLFIGS